MNIKPFVVRLSDEEHELFKEISFDNRVSIQQIFKKMVKEYLKENREQSRHNDVQIANDAQAQYLLEEINRRFDEQNKILADQNDMLSRLMKLLVRDNE